MSEAKEPPVIEGQDEDISPDEIERGEALISYSDCYECHKEGRKAKGPSFQDVAKRYPRNQQFIDILAGKVLSGGSGNWGTPIMTPHSEIPLENAKAMVAYILSLE